MVAMNEHEQRLLQQANILSAMMVAVTRELHVFYARKHVGAVWEEMLVAFALWESDTILKPQTVLGISKTLGIPRSNVRRALHTLVEIGIARRIKDGYGRNTDLIVGQTDAPFFHNIRETIINAGEALRRIEKDK